MKHILFLLPFVILLYKSAYSQASLNIKTDIDTSTTIISDIRIGGNKKTVDKIILREMLFYIGDTVDLNQLDELIKKSKENLFNTSLFNYITINALKESEKYHSIYILVEERWYLWPQLIFEHAGRNLSAFLHERDWTKVNYGLMVVKNNFRGRKERVKVKVRLGYKEQFQIYYETPMLFNSRQHGLSTEFSWYRQNETSFEDFENKQQFYKEENNYILKYYTTQFTYKYRQEYYTQHQLSLNYTFGQINDSILSLNPNYFDYGKSSTQFFVVNYFFSVDKRDYRHYPLKGYFYEFQAKQSGLGLLSNELDGIWELNTTYTGFYGLTHRWYTGFGTKLKISTNREQPYFVERALGYNDFLRGYEYYVINGQHFVTGRSFLKYEIVPTRITTLDFLKWDKFNKIHYALYGNLFFDSGYVWDINKKTNNLANSYLMSVGFGLDLVAYYDQIIRFEYTINRDLEHGFYLHVGKAF